MRCLPVGERRRDRAPVEHAARGGDLGEEVAARSPLHVLLPPARLRLAAPLAPLDDRDADPERDGGEHSDDDGRHDRDVRLGLRQRVLHQEDRDARVLDARLHGDSDDAPPRLGGQRRQRPAHCEPHVRHEAAGNEERRRDETEDVEVGVDAEREHEDDEEDDHRLKETDDDGGDARMAPLQEEADRDGDEEGEERHEDVEEGDVDGGVIGRQVTTEGEEPQRDHPCNTPHVTAHPTRPT